MKAASNFYPRVFAVVMSALLGYALVLVFAPFAGSMAWAAFLAFLLFPANLRLRRRFRGRASAAALLTVLAPIVVLLPLSALSIDFVEQISTLLRALEGSARKLDIKTFADLQQFPLIAHANAWLQAHASISAEQVQGWLITGVREVLQKSASFSGSFFLGALNSVIGIALMLFLLFFFLRDGDRMIERGVALIPLEQERKERLFDDLAGIARAIVFGTSMTALLQGAMVGVGFSITGLPSPVVFGVISALFAILPVGGPALVWVPAAGWLFFEGSWGYGAFLVVWGAILTGIDHVLRPMLISGRAPISTLAVFIGVLGGISAFGPIGIVAGPLVLSLALELVQFAEETRPETG
jgi:predicted PurR-regulated permease PerM